MEAYNTGIECGHYLCGIIIYQLRCFWSYFVSVLCLLGWLHSAKDLQKDAGLQIQQQGFLQKDHIILSDFPCT